MRDRSGPPARVLLPTSVLAVLIVLGSWAPALGAPLDDAWDAWKRGRLADAVAASQRAVEATPADPYAWTLHGYLLSTSGQRVRARSAYERAAELDPQNAVVQNNLGVVLMAQGEIDAAVPRFRRALALRPGYADAWNNLGAGLERQGQRREAAGAYDQAARANPEHALAQHNLGTLALRRGDVQEARRRLSRAEALDPGLGAPALNLLLLGDPDAVEGLRFERLQALARRPGAPVIVRARAFAAVGGRAASREDYTAARAAYLQALELTPEDPTLLNNVGVAEDRLGLDRDAMLHFQEALRLRPDLHVARNNIGIVHVHRGSISMAEDTFRAILDVDPRFHRAWYNLGVVEAAEGRLREAVTSLSRAASLAPLDASVRYNLGVVHRRLGGSDVAERRAYEEALRLDPTLAEAHLSLGCLLADPQTVPSLRDEAQARTHLQRFMALAGAHDPVGRERAEAWLTWLARRAGR